MYQVVEFLRSYGLEIIAWVVLVCNTVLAIVNAVKAKQFVKFNDIIASCGVDDIIELVRDLPPKQQNDFFNKCLKEVEKNGKV